MRDVRRIEVLRGLRERGPLSVADLRAITKVADARPRGVDVVIA